MSLQSYLTVQQNNRNELYITIMPSPTALLDACMRCDLLEATNLASRLSPVQTATALNMTCGTGSSTLHRACEQNNTELTHFLLSRGATVHVHPVTGFSPLHSACAAAAEECTKILLEVCCVSDPWVLFCWSFGAPFLVQNYVSSGAHSASLKLQWNSTMVFIQILLCNCGISSSYIMISNGMYIKTIDFSAVNFTLW